MIDNKTIRKVIMLNKLLPSGSPTYEDREAEGAIANFTTNVVKPFVKCECEILPIQEGTGTPSPSNPRPISGTDELTLTHTTYRTAETYTFDLGQEILGGTADVVGGVGTKNKTGRVLNGTEAWFLVRSGEYTTVFALGAAMSVVDQNEQICSHFNFNSQANAVSQSRANTFVQGTSGNLFIQVSNDLATTIEGFKSWLASEYANGTPVSYVAKTTPTDFTFTGQPINSSLGVNNVWTDSGNTKVTYKYKTGEGGSTKKKYLPIFYDFYRKGCRHL